MILASANCLQSSNDFSAEETALHLEADGAPLCGQVSLGAWQVVYFAQPTCRKCQRLAAKGVAQGQEVVA